MNFRAWYPFQVSRKPYPGDVSDDEWAFVAPYLTLMKEDAPQRAHPLREVFNGLCWLVRAGASWRLMPNDLPALVHRLSTNATLTESRRFYLHRQRFMRTLAVGSRAFLPTAE